MDQFEYDAIVLDTSTFDANGLRLEKGLLGKLGQFKKSPVDIIIPDVVRGELKTHLERKIKEVRSSLEKSIKDAGSHILLEDGHLDAITKLIPDASQVERLAEQRIESFIDQAGAIELECGNHVNITEILRKYFDNTPPFSESGKKKSEFPDAIALTAIENWAILNKKNVLTISKDGDWKKFSEASERITNIEELSDALALFNQPNAPYAFLAKLEAALDAGAATSFIKGLEDGLSSALDGFTPDQEAECYISWEPEGSNGWFTGVDLDSNELRLIEQADDYIVLEAEATIRFEAEGEFTLSVRDSIDGDYIPLSYITAATEGEFESKILITVAGDIEGNMEELEIENVEIVSVPRTVNFGMLEPDFGGNE
ncbi:hypothetical protein EY04_10155 [Pseudomonas chlororaphis]|uniref:PIN domain-containing protein n=1 Tax=Pseudomonas chlororaphis TaxID=587753 RepID=UPI0004AC0866|nr:PIN domain-containing protein [Pseudomonas chlororaphis]AIC19240.1 hypothetical protein EY04_10155 [Pseudomonas chlororaphis]